MKKGNFLVLGLVGLLVAPAVVYGISSLMGLIEFLTDSIILPIIGLIGALAVLFFLWGVMKFIKDAADPKAREEGRQFMLYGIIGLFVMASVYGLVRILENTFQLPNSGGSVSAPSNNTIDYSKKIDYSRTTDDQGINAPF